jgi:putative nucleotidyltransferase with HDIG domain
MDAIPQEVWMQFLINLSRHIDTRVSFTGKHSAQVAFWVRATARKFECSEAETQSIFWAALLHDIGKVGVPEEILSKAGPLSPNEWELMRMHPTIGANIVRSLNSIQHIAPFIYHHQERYDGTGYPYGLKGDAIPFGARVLAVADAFEAMTNDRYYRQARSREAAADELRQMSGKDFDPEIVDAFLEVLAEVMPKGRPSVPPAMD